jgi:hypothetical protein
MKRTAYIVLTLAALAGAAFALAPQRDIATSIRIAAPPERVWSILTDTAAFPAWNPEMTLKGALIQGHIIEHDEGSGDDRMVFHPVIVAMVPNHDLAWLGHSGPPRFFDALHSFHLAADGGGTIFTQTEHLRGVLLWLWDAGQLLPRFQAMNEALKARAEQLP